MVQEKVNRKGLITSNNKKITLNRLLLIYFLTSLYYNVKGEIFFKKLSQEELVDRVKNLTDRKDFSTLTPIGRVMIKLAEVVE